MIRSEPPSMPARDPYVVLGVPRNADAAALKAAYRSLAKRFHPDGDPKDRGRAERFKEVGAAYALLSDPVQRARFDRGEIDADGQPIPASSKRGHQSASGVRSQPPPHRSQTRSEPGRSQAGGTATQSGAKPNGNTNGGFETTLRAGGQAAGEIFSGLMEGLGRGARRILAKKGGDLRQTLSVTLEELAEGVTKRMRLEFPAHVEGPKSRMVNVRVPAGMDEDKVIRLKGAGLPGSYGGAPGDALITILTEPHGIFTREGTTLSMERTVSLQQAVLGAKVPVETLYGTVNLSIPAGSNTGSVLRLKGKGLPEMGKGESSRGDLLVRLVVKLTDPTDPKLMDFLTSRPAGSL